MTGTISAMFDVSDDRSQQVTIRIWSKTGAIFQEIFPIDQTTFAHVKCLAMQFLVNNTNRSLKVTHNYKLVSIETRKTIDEEKTLSQEKVKDGDEYLLTKKPLQRSSEHEQTLDRCLIDEKLIEIRTRNLAPSAHSLSQIDRSMNRTEFPGALSGILLTLIETSQKLLWFHPDAENIFRQAEAILSKSIAELDDGNIHHQEIKTLVDMGFTQRQVQIALKRTKHDIPAAMELLLNQPDIDDNEKEMETSNKKTPFYSSTGPFIPFRQIRHQYFQPNQTTLQSLQEMGFNQNDITNALRICRNNQNLACDYLIANKQQQQNIIDATNDQGLDTSSSLFRAIMENPLIQQSLNNPKTFFVMLQLYEDPSSITSYITDPDIGNMLLQINHIYHAERYQMNAPR